MTMHDDPFLMQKRKDEHRKLVAMSEEELGKLFTKQRNDPEFARLFDALVRWVHEDEWWTTDEDDMLTMLLAKVEARGFAKGHAEGVAEGFAEGHAEDIEELSVKFKETLTARYEKGRAEGAEQMKTKIRNAAVVTDAGFYNPKGYYVPAHVLAPTKEGK
jgi:hypothetical protein